MQRCVTDLLLMGVAGTAWTLSTTSIARTAVIYARKKQLPREKLVFWKFDLRKSYILLSYSSARVSKVGVRLHNNLFMFFIGGVFSLTGMPMAFQVVARAIVFEISRLIQGALVQYVDDGVVCSHEGCVESDSAIVFNFLMLLFVPNHSPVRSLS
jgi:hypothetical protein